jgi:WD40 repeat protein
VGHAQVGTGAVALGVDVVVAGNARAGTNVTLAAGASAELSGTFVAGSYILTGASTTPEQTGGVYGGLFTNTGAVTLGASNIIGAYDCTSSLVEPDHFSIEHDGTAINCLAEDIKISAHKANHTVEAWYTGRIDLSTSTNHADWSWVSGVVAISSEDQDLLFAEADTVIRTWYCRRLQPILTLWLVRLV